MTTYGSDTTHSPGDPEREFRCIVAGHQRRITTFATRMLGGDEAAAQDVAQETFLSLWRQRQRDDGKYPLPNHLDRYLLRIAHNRCIDILRVRREPIALDAERDAASSAGRPENVTEASSLGEAVRDAIALLPESQRSVFILSHYDGLRYQEIADLLDCPIGTVASRKSQAVATLRLRLKDWSDDVGTGTTGKTPCS